MEDALSCGNREPTLGEVLAEPIVRQMMKRDGVQETQIHQLLGNGMKLPAAKIRWRAAEPGTKPSGYPQANFGMLPRSQSTVPAWPRVFPGL